MNIVYYSIFARLKHLATTFAILITCSDNKIAIAAEGTGARLPQWQRMPSQIQVTSKADEPLAIEVKIANKDPVIKYCDALLTLRTGIDGPINREVKASLRSFLIEIDSVYKLQLSLSEIVSKTIVPGSVHLALSCLGTSATEDTTLLAPSNGCNPMRMDCDNVCIASGDLLESCQTVKPVFTEPMLTQKHNIDATELTFKLTSNAKNNLRCGIITTVPATKSGTTTTVLVKKSLNNTPVQIGDNSFSFEIKDSAAGTGYVIDFSKSRLYVSCIEGPIGQVEMWNIAEMTQPDVKNELNWVLSGRQ